MRRFERGVNENVGQAGGEAARVPTPDDEFVDMLPMGTESWVLNDDIGYNGNSDGSGAETHSAQPSVDNQE